MAKSDKTIIELRDIYKDYVSEVITTNVLKGISLKVKKGEFIAIIGPSGSGKSTLMNIIGLLDTPTKGSYVLNGTNAVHLTEDELAFLRNREIGFVFQSFNLLRRATTLDNVLLPAIYAGISAPERVKRAKEILTKLGLQDRLNNRPNQLSGGQQQRVAIARSLMNNPELILADEPTGNLDTKSGKDVMNILKELNREGKTIVVITHEYEVAKQAKRTIRLVDGRIV